VKPFRDIDTPTTTIEGDMRSLMKCDDVPLRVRVEVSELLARSIEEQLALVHKGLARLESDDLEGGARLELQAKTCMLALRCDRLADLSATFSAWCAANPWTPTGEELAGLQAELGGAILEGKNELAVSLLLVVLRATESAPVEVPAHTPSDDELEETWERLAREEREAGRDESGVIATHGDDLDEAAQ
jgi:hypothetical protein